MLRVDIDDFNEAPGAMTPIQPTAVNTPNPQHARNYMDKEPKLPTSQIDPHRPQYDPPPSRDLECALWHASGGGDIHGHRPAR